MRLKRNIFPGSLILVLLFCAGCGGGSGSKLGTTSTGGGTSGSGSATTGSGSTNASVVSGWSNLGTGSYSQAKTAFTNVVNSSTASAADKAEAYAGLGWTEVKSAGGFYDSNGIFNSSIVTYFNGGQALLEDAKVGLAVAYLHRNSSSADSSSALTLLEGVLADDSFTPVSNIIGIARADVWLLMAIARMETGDSAGAATALEKARSLGSTADATVFANISAALDTLL